jgi:hypothetical protein
MESRGAPHVVAAYADNLPPARVVRPFRSRVPRFPLHPELLVIRFGAVLAEVAYLYRALAVGILPALPLVFVALVLRVIVRIAPRLYGDKSEVSLP